MNKTMIAAALLLATFARADEAKPAAPPSTEDAQVAAVDSAHYKPVEAKGSMPAGVQASLLAKDPASGGTVAYAKLPPGTVLPMHFHSHAEYTVLVSGKGELTLDGKKHEVGPGAYIVVPPKAHHALTCGADAECVLFTRRAGPTDYNWVK